MLFNPQEPEHRQHSHPAKKGLFNGVAAKQIEQPRAAGEGQLNLQHRRGGGANALGGSPPKGPPPRNNVFSAEENVYQLKQHLHAEDSEGKSLAAPQ